ncbi:hypothetical protein B4168_2193 [Anoxybacillus flavithermus]|nr:hypothetical protein B4168_2193 [Anoxybacillus flavithermus]OAO85849.1 hypothetical protein GT23_2752 [Parageobacillus thermoglucosidasius]
MLKLANSKLIHHTIGKKRLPHARKPLVCSFGVFFFIAILLL